MLTIKNLSYAYSRKIPILHGINLTIDKGFNLLIGENGSGKTTFIKNLTTILPIQQGSIALDGVSITDSSYRKKISYLPQSFDVYPQLTVQEILLFVASAKSGMNKKSASKHLAEIVALTNTYDYLHKRLKDCSEGMRRRVGIATALIGSPDVVVLDEPTAGIDPKERIQFYKTIQTCFTGKTVLISTHILDDIDFLATKVIMLSNGEIKYDGEYSAFRQSLEGQIFDITCDPSQVKNVLQKYRVLTTSQSGGLSQCRIVSEKTPQDNILFKSVVSAHATSEDIWVYYQGGDINYV